MLNQQTLFKKQPCISTAPENRAESMALTNCKTPDYLLLSPSLLSVHWSLHWVQAHFRKYHLWYEIIILLIRHSSCLTISVVEVSSSPPLLSSASTKPCLPLLSHLLELVCVLLELLLCHSFYFGNRSFSPVFLMLVCCHFSSVENTLDKALPLVHQSSDWLWHPQAPLHLNRSCSLCCLLMS